MKFRGVVHFLTETNNLTLDKNNNERYMRSTIFASLVLA
jgi:hypothetical protein